MRIEELIEELQAIATAHPGTKVKFRQLNGNLTTIDEASFESDTFGNWAELA